MNIFYEFHKIMLRLQDADIRYALIGGVAIAIYTEFRATKDIDFLIYKDDFEKLKQAIVAEGFIYNDFPVKFKSGFTLHRFNKFLRGEDNPLMVDVLIADTKEHQEIVDRAKEAILETTGNIKLALPEDLIELKEKRGSDQDKADIAKLRKLLNEN